MKKRFAVRLAACFTVFAVCSAALAAQATVLTIEDAVQMAFNNNISLERNALTLQGLERAKNHAWNSFSPSLSVGGGFQMPNKPAAQGLPYDYALYGQAAVGFNISPALIAAIKTASLQFEAGELSFNEAVRSTNRINSMEYSEEINNDLERIGDYAYSIARFVLETDAVELDAELVRRLRLEQMFSVVLEMMSGLKQSLEEMDPAHAVSVIAMDDTLDAIKAASGDVLVDYARKNIDAMPLCMGLGGVFRKLERAGDHLSNIAEEIVFYIDAKVLKHPGTSEQ